MRRRSKIADCVALLSPKQMLMRQSMRTAAKGESVARASLTPTQPQTAVVVGLLNGCDQRAIKGIRWSSSA